MTDDLPRPPIPGCAAVDCPVADTCGPDTCFTEKPVPCTCGHDFNDHTPAGICEARMPRRGSGGRGAECPCRSFAHRFPGWPAESAAAVRDYTHEVCAYGPDHDHATNLFRCLYEPRTPDAPDPQCEACGDPATTVDNLESRVPLCAGCKADLCAAEGVPDAQAATERTNP